MRTRFDGFPIFPHIFLFIEISLTFLIRISAISTSINSRESPAVLQLAINVWGVAGM